MDFRADLRPFARASAEMLQMVQQLGPDGLALMAAFCSAHRSAGFSIGRVAEVDGVAVMIREPSPEFLAFIEDLRRRCAEGGRDA